MRVILELEENVLVNLQTLADTSKRSRKSYMEFILTNASGINGVIAAVETKGVIVEYSNPAKDFVKTKKPFMSDAIRKKLGL